MSHSLISTLIDAFETKMRSERALWEHRLQTEIASLRQALLSVVPQSINSNGSDVLQIQEEQQMLRDMIVDLQDSFEGLNRRFISSKVSLPSEDDEMTSDDDNDDDDSSPKNEIIYPPIHVEKEGAARSEEHVVIVKAAPAPAPEPVKTAPTPTPEPVKVAAPPTPEPEEEEEEEEEEVEEELELEEFTFKGRSLFKDADGNIYDESGENVIGRKTEKGVAFFRK